MSAARPVTVVGGGLAGISAALRLADDGFEVVLHEARPRLGGLAGSFVRSAETSGLGVDLQVDTGQHVFMRCCSAYRGLLRRLGAEGDTHLQRRLDVPVRRPGVARTSHVRRAALPVPLHLARSLLGYAPLTLAERLAAARAALALGRVERSAADGTSFGAWLAAHGQGSRAVEALWDLVGVATLNARADDASLALAATVFQTGLLGEPGGADLGWARVPLGRIHGDAALAALRTAGVDVRLGSRVASLELDGRAVVLAVPPAAAERLLPPSALDLRPGWAGRLGASPIVNVHVVLDRRVLDGELVAGVGTPVQFVFDRSGQSGLRAHSPDAQYLAVSLSAADREVRLPSAELLARMVPALRELLPAARGAGVLDAFVTREPQATFRPAPGSAADRPPAATSVPGVVLAGAWTATGWPATMEGAVRSGLEAARLLAHAPTPERTAL
ncbi:squalene-associated FAD-dependent desaturase [Motilibacter peucedani]|uniref:Squalene-associated FAD-dependent desaturase n=1 Tax=Motilibacter peucedani TaxID=598650 RepID=A0A420XKF6_9ACTN|nr:squalene-associated FAD-dependent desaturase [Motilibacter peucedani]